LSKQAVVQSGKFQLGVVEIVNLHPEMHPDLIGELHRIESTHWWYRGRRKILQKLLMPHLDVIPPGPILDLGSGPGTNSRVLEPIPRKLFALDSSLDALRYCRERNYANGVLADAIATPYQDRTFSLVFAADILEHIADDEMAAAEIFRILKPSGVAVIVVPAYKILWGWQDEISGHYRRYSPARLRSLISNSGLEIVRLTCMNLLLALPILFARGLLRLTGFSPKSENALLPDLLNPILYSAFIAEMPLLYRLDIPYGTSVVCFARRAN
jgi:SAM-dependent methyltransferase